MIGSTNTGYREFYILITLGCVLFATVHMLQRTQKGFYFHLLTVETKYKIMKNLLHTDKYLAALELVTYKKLSSFNKCISFNRCDNSF